MLTKLKAAVLPTFEIEVGETVYRLVLDMNALAKAGDELKKDLTGIESWKNLTGPELTIIAWAALDRFHPEVPLREVRSWLGAVDKNALFVNLIEAAWPGIIERIDRHLKEQERDNLGKTGPNPPAATQE